MFLEQLRELSVEIEELHELLADTRGTENSGESCNGARPIDASSWSRSLGPARTCERSPRQRI